MLIKYFNDPGKLLNMTGILLGGVGTTVSIFALTLVLSIPLGILVSQGRMSRHWIVSRPVSFYIYIMRSTPLMLQVMFIYFLLPQVLPFRFDRFWAVIFSFVINYAAYFAEIFRGGILSIPPAARIICTRLLLVFPRTRLSSTTTTDFPWMTSRTGLNLIFTLATRWFWVGLMNVRPT
jgi:His/Glu/Gln/Arg/opine family amino acid ABC transporter permease subunit